MQEQIAGDVAAFDWSTLPTVGISWELGLRHGWGVHGFHLAKRIMERRIASIAPLAVCSLTEDERHRLGGPLTDLGGRQPDSIIIAGHNHPGRMHATTWGKPFFDAGTANLILVLEDATLDGIDCDYLKRYGDRIVVLSLWNQHILREVGIPSVYAPMGVDTEMFHPRNAVRSDEFFTVFSGGKLEFRKGQDIVVAAFKVFHERHANTRLTTMWHNPWPDIARDLVKSPHTLAWRAGESPADNIHQWVTDNGVSAEAFADLGPMSRGELANFLPACDVALFCNRAEGGTNMVAMEALASGVPCILSDSTGHKDLISSPIPCYALERSTETPGHKYWADSDLEEVIEALEHVYQNRGEARKTGTLAADIMHDMWDWNSRCDAQIAAMNISMDPGAVQLRRKIAEAQRTNGSTPPASLSTDDKKRMQDAMGFATYAEKLRDARLFAAAESTIRRAARLAPDNGAVMANFGNLLISFDKHGASLDASEKALKLEPRLAQPINHNMGLAHLHMGQLESALKHFDTAASHSVDAEFDRAVCLMMMGRWKNGGWAASEVRRKRAAKDHPKYKMPEWDGQPFIGTLWVTVEQGLGDMFQFSRFLPWAKNRCARLLFSVPPHLVSIYRGYPGVDEFLSFDQAAEEPDADFHVPLQSLATFCNPDPDDVPLDPGHFKERFSRVNAKLNATPGNLKVGICWAGAAHHQHDNQRSMPLERLLPLAEDPKISLLSLQEGKHAKDVDEIGAHLLVTDISSALTNWAATGAAILQLDVVVTVDTAVAHMAGCLGVPTFLMVTRFPDWRWLLRRDDTPWYPSMRIFRQKKHGDWSDVIETIRKRLSVLAARQS